MKREMEMEEIEAILEKIWDLHDKLSDAIHSISRTHFLNSVKTLRKSHYNKSSDDNASGFVFVKDFPFQGDDSAIQEAKSLNAIRTALENLEDQLEFFHTIQTQQRAERDAAIARLEQSRIVLAMRLAEHNGKKYKVIEEALAFVGDVKGTGHFISRDSLCGQPCCPDENFVTDKGKRSNILMNVLLSSFNFAKKALRLDNMSGIVGNAALVAVSMVAFLHLHHVAYQEHPHRQENSIYSNKTGNRKNQLEGSSSNPRSSNLNLLLARG
ncbi:plastid division protein PDV1 [Senna tora]|uniref:Plastid division protein PDV1 n=1 Tax=Senna tora TaxID=362788 RepID=A0A834TY07_9FABA|nr:plastid division protein PDV1 [Senna tora]